MAFGGMHTWLTKRGLKTDQVKNELMHFSKSRNQNTTPRVHIPTNNPGALKEATLARCMCYLGLWFDPKLKFHKHVKIAASKASRATEALQMLGNSTCGLNQQHLRQMYLGAVLPIATYGSLAFWDGKTTYIKNTL